MPVVRRANSAPRGPRGIGIQVFPGSVQEARHAAGLSLAQLCGGDITRSAISLIEQGGSKPSLKTLRLIAARTGRRLSTFATDTDILGAMGLSSAQLDLDLTTLERLYELDRYSEVLEKAEALLPIVAGLNSEFDCRYWIARASYMTGDTEMGIVESEVCAAHYEASGWALRWAECLDCKGCALIVAQDIVGAAEAFKRALTVLDGISPDPFDVRSRVLAHLGNAQVEAHDFDSAVKTLKDAVREAHGLRDLGRIGGMYEDLALSYSELGQFARALQYANRAVAMHRRRQDWLALANAENNLGYVLFRRGALKEARDHVDVSLRLYEEIGIERRKAHSYLSLAEIDIAEGNIEAAEAEVRSAAELAGRLDEKPNLAVAWLLMGRIAERRTDRRGADKHFRASINLLEDLDAKDRLADAYREFGQVLEARGDDKAALRYLKAALDASRGVVRAGSMHATSDHASA